jgi:hypothetical protein
MAPGSCGIRGLGQLALRPDDGEGPRTPSWKFAPHCSPPVTILGRRLRARSGSPPVTILGRRLRARSGSPPSEQRQKVLVALKAHFICVRSPRHGERNVPRRFPSCSRIRANVETLPVIGRLRELLPFGPVHRSVSGIFLILVANSTSRLIASARDGRSVWPRRQSSTIRKNCSDTRI